MYSRGWLVLFGFAVLAVQISLCSVVTENMYFPRITKNVVRKDWQNIFSSLDLSKTSYACTKFVQ